MKVKRLEGAWKHSTRDTASEVDNPSRFTAPFISFAPYTRAMKKILFIFTLLACSSVALTHAVAGSQRPTPAAVLYDPKIKTPEPKLNPALEGRIMEDAAGMKDAQGRALCPPRDTRVRGVASGSFTRAKAKQTAYLVFGCRVTLETETYGLLIYENSRLISSSHLTVTDLYGLAREFYGVRDLNNNGLSELALRWSTGDGCCFFESLALLEWKGVGWKTLGQLPLLYGEDENNLSSGFINFNYTLYVQKGARPVFVGVDALNKNLPTVLELERAILEVKTF